MHFVGIDAGPKWPLFYSHVDPVWSLLIVGTCCIFGRAPRTKEILPDFHEWCRVTRHPRVFCRLAGCQRDTPFLGIHIYSLVIILFEILFVVFTNFLGTMKLN